MPLWPTLLLVLCLGSTVVSLVVGYRLIVALRRVRWVNPPVGGPQQRRKLSVIMPARNEERDVERSLRSVLAQQDVDMEVIVVNDHSTDRTRDILEAVAREDPRVQVLHDPPLPPGWLGKVNAMQQAADRATGELLLFTDADVLHRPRCFVTGLAELERSGLDFLSLYPLMHYVTLVENLLMPAMVGGIVHLLKPGLEDPRSPDALGVGAFLLVKAEVFRSAGGFGPIRTEMFDDVSLARHLKQSGYRVGFRTAPQFLEVRLFKNNRDAFFGMTKNVLAILHGHTWLAVPVMLFGVYVFVTPILAVAFGWVWGDWPLAGVGALTYAIQYGCLLLGWEIFRFNPVKALLHPLGLVPVVSCFCRAMYHMLSRGEVVWRGRAVRIRG